MGETERIHSLESNSIASLLEDAAALSLSVDRRLDEIFKEILRVANQFVPSRSGSILLRDGQTVDQLVFVASFGEGAENLVGRVVPPGRGISGSVYRSGEPAVANDPRSNQNFYDNIDTEIEHETRSLLCVPILIGASPIGVLSLVNRTEGPFLEKDLALLEVFSGYVSASLNEVLQARHHAEMAKMDHLTGLYNDRYFFEVVSREMARVEQTQENLGLIFFDLDHFKSVVDRHGHLVGSQALREVGLLLARTVDHPGAKMARYGGDEYVVLLPGADLETIAQQAELIRWAVENAVLLCQPDAEGNPGLKLERAVTASVGTASLKHCQLAGQDLRAKRHRFIRLADEAMYRAKAEGKNRVCSAHDFGGRPLD
ncbi:MAG: sensor domain-containing diguanylate cyclase [Vulcanimicrobiota bacterium]